MREDSNWWESLKEEDELMKERRDRNRDLHRAYMQGEITKPEWIQLLDEEIIND